MSNNKKIFATPKVRKFARELGANISEVEGSERLGRITEEDVKNLVNKNLNKSKIKENIKVKSEFEHSDFGEIEVIDMPRIKRLAAKHLSNSWSTIPHVTHHDEADITELEDFRTKLIDPVSGIKLKVTPLAFIIKALCNNLKKFPTFNSSINNIDGGKITLKKYFHIGVAVDTEHGLMVPKIRDVEKKKINEIAEELKKVSDLSKSLKIDKKEFFGGSMTITSLGGIGGTFFTPIINPPEVAILGIGKIVERSKNLMLPLSLSYDHRVVNGADAARFCNELKDNLGENFAYKLSL